MHERQEDGALVQLDAVQLETIVLPSLHVETDSTGAERHQGLRERQDVRALGHVKVCKVAEVDGQPDRDVARRRVRTERDPKVREVEDGQLEARGSPAIGWSVQCGWSHARAAHHHVPRFSSHLPLYA